MLIYKTIVNNISMIGRRFPTEVGFELYESKYIELTADCDLYKILTDQLELGSDVILTKGITRKLVISDEHMKVEFDMVKVVSSNPSGKKVLLHYESFNSIGESEFLYEYDKFIKCYRFNIPIS